MVVSSGSSRNTITVALSAGAQLDELIAPFASNPHALTALALRNARIITPTATPAQRLSLAMLVIRPSFRQIVGEYDSWRRRGGDGMSFGVNNAGMIAEINDTAATMVGQGIWRRDLLTDRQVNALLQIDSDAEAMWLRFTGGMSALSA